MAAQPQFTVRKTGLTFGIFRDGILVEGGFFSRHAAEHAAREWEHNTNG